MDFRVIILLMIIPLINCKNKVDQGELDKNVISEGFKYLKQKPPSLIPEIFAPGLISTKNGHEYGSVFSKDGTEFFYGANGNIKYTKLVGENWSDPQIILNNCGDPFLSPDEKRLYFISRMLEGESNKKNNDDIWYVEKVENGWSEPINAGANINSEQNDLYSSFTNDGTMYFTSNRDIYRSKSIDGIFQKSISLGDSINTAGYEGDAFIDPNEAYIIFSSIRPGCLGVGDLHISFKKANGTWTKPKNMGSSINSKAHENCPFVSYDGKYLFYASKGDIYWVDAKVIEQYR